MTRIALIGAGGKMGARTTDNLLKTDHEARYVEVSEAGRAEIAIVFQELPNGAFSAGARRAIEKAKTQLFRPDGKNVFEPNAIRQSIFDITQPPGA